MLFFVVANPGFARETGHTVYGSVTDNITGNGIAAKVTLMTVDSVVIASQTARIDTNIYTSRTFGSYSFEPGVSKVGKYIIKAEAPATRRRTSTSSLSATVSRRLACKRYRWRGRGRTCRR